MGATVFVQPLDLIKNRMQMLGNHYVVTIIVVMLSIMSSECMHYKICVVSC